MDDLWNIDVESRKRRLTWWWWFWLLFIDDAPGQTGSSGHMGPRQFMILWSTKNCRRIRVDDQWWSPRQDISRDDGSLNFDGMAASWYFDGRTMWDPMTLERSLFLTSGDARSGALRQVGSEGHEHLFSLEEGRHRVHVSKGDFDIDVELTGEGPLAMGMYKDNVGTSRHGFSILRKKRLDMTGTVTHRGTTEEIVGTGYFQKVMVNAPAPPWFWGTVHMGDGSYVQYFQPHIGLPMLRRRRGERSPLNALRVPFARSIEYFDAGTGESHRLKAVKVRRGMRKGHPVFRVASRGDGAELGLELETYSRACWSFRQPLVGPIATLLFYNEYPSRLTGFRFSGEARRVGFGDVDGGIGNAEHSWGFLF